MTDAHGKSSDWIEDDKFNNPKSPVVEQIKFTVENQLNTLTEIN